MPPRALLVILYVIALAVPRQSAKDAAAGETDAKKDGTERDEEGGRAHGGLILIGGVQKLDARAVAAAVERGDAGLRS
jgi:hypothetical protein